MALLTGLTIDDFEQLPDAVAKNHELVKGELIDVSGNIGGHNGLRDALVEVLSPFVRRNKLGRIVSEQEFEFDEETAYGPDVSFLGPDKAKRFDRQLRVQRFVPDLAIEIASKSDKFEALMEKALLYQRCGVKEVYLFSVQIRQVFRYVDQPVPTILTESQDFRPGQIPGFSIRIADLLAMI
jgi:Uma2 family endonuclease